MVDSLHIYYEAMLHAWDGNCWHENRLSREQETSANVR